MTEQQGPSGRAMAGRSRMTGPQRRESILVAATEVFAEVGYQRARTAAVARRIGVSEPVIFQNFGTKAELFAAAVRRRADQICAWLADFVARQESVSALLATVLDPVHLQRVHTPGSIGALFADASAITGEPVIEAASQDATRRIAVALAAVLEHGRCAGELRADLDVEAGAWWLLSLTASQKFRRATAPDSVDVESRLAETVLDFLVGQRRHD
ncbi:TetR/AcrR family transcriptional regulator [Saccharomonospora xinjiangensis]|nr:TetR/AcrR family transcriptional regulator [Saccharomonospora xinjiangensis]